VKQLLRCIVCYLGHVTVSILPASAEPSTADALERYRLGDPAMFAFLLGNLNGWIWANADLEAGGSAKLFCAPPSLDLSVQREVDVTIDHLKGAPADGTRPVGSVMLQSLKQAFPCK
jgi:Ssp1 endopeptidase immunity protein Rap1a